MKGLMQPHLSSEYFQQQIAKSDSALAWQYDLMLRFARVRLHHETCVLDVGCGAAPGLRYLRQRGVAAVGVDVSAAALAAARELAPDAALVRCDLFGMGNSMRRSSVNWSSISRRCPRCWPICAACCDPAARWC
jgi:SAM-dependent methyltransferase